MVPSVVTRPVIMKTSSVVVPGRVIVFVSVKPSVVPLDMIV